MQMYEAPLEDLTELIKHEGTKLKVIRAKNVHVGKVLLFLNESQKQLSQQPTRWLKKRKI